MIRVVLATDNSEVQKAVEEVLNLTKEIELVGHAVNGSDAVKLVEQKRPEVILIDIDLPPKGGLSHTKEIKGLFPKIPVIILTSADNLNTILEIFKSGANGYYPKNQASSSLLNFIRCVYDDGIILPKEISQKLSGSDILQILIENNKKISQLLSEREIEILKLIVSGKTNSEIAMELNITVGTVKNHVTNLLKKTGAKDRINLILYAIKTCLEP